MKKLLLVFSFFLAANAALADRAFQLSFTPDIAIVPSNETVRGVALNVWGENQVNGLSFGFVNGLRGESSGLSYSFIGTYAESYTGVIWGGFFSYSSGDVVGWQAGLANVNQGSFVGLQTGLVNVGKDFKGLQWGLINYTENLHGVQLGLINVVASNPWFTELPDKLATGFPFVNWSF